VIKSLAVAAALVATLGTVADSCSLDGGGDRSTERKSPPVCPPDFDLRRISNREFVCTVDGTPNIPVSARCPRGWTIRSVSEQRIRPPDRRAFTTAVRWRCLDL
jgi:hypothetical protein